MAKIVGLVGSISGRIGNTVMTVRGGEQIARVYQPNVANPSTPRQVESRAKLKLLSQTSAVFAPVLAFRRQNNVSPRNLFVRANYATSTYADNKATLSLTDIDLTRGVLSLPAIIANRDKDAGTVTLRMGSLMVMDIDRLVYATMAISVDNTLRLIDYRIVEASVGNERFEVSFPDSSPALDIVVYAYGIRDNTKAAKAVFGELNVPADGTIAEILTSRRLTETDITFTETRSQVSESVS